MNNFRYSSNLETMNKVVRIVIITDHSEIPYSSTIDSVWNRWTDASMRVDELNKEFEEDKDCDLHAHYIEEIVRDDWS